MEIHHPNKQAMFLYLAALARPVAVSPLVCTRIPNFVAQLLEDCRGLACKTRDICVTAAELNRFVVHIPLTFDFGGVCGLNAKVKRLRSTVCPSGQRRSDKILQKI